MIANPYAYWQPYLAAVREAFKVTREGGKVRTSWAASYLDAEGWRTEFRDALDRRITARVSYTGRAEACRCRCCTARCSCGVVSQADRRAVPRPVVTRCGRCTRGRRMGDDYQRAAERDARAIRDASAGRRRVYVTEITTDDWRKRFAHLFASRED